LTGPHYYGIKPYQNHKQKIDMGLRMEAKETINHATNMGGLMSQDLRSLADYAHAAGKIVDDLKAEGLDEGQILDLLPMIKKEITLRLNIAWEEERSSRRQDRDGATGP